MVAPDVGAAAKLACSSGREIVIRFRGDRDYHAYRPFRTARALNSVMGALERYVFAADITVGITGC